MSVGDLEYSYLRGLQGLPVPVPHTHPETDVTGLPADIANRALANHTHAETDVAGLGTDLSSKAAAIHSHPQADISNLVASLAAKAASVHTHAESEVTALTNDISVLTTAVNGKAPAAHSHAETDVSSLGTDLTNINNALAGKAASSHSHAESDITGLLSALAGLAPAFRSGTVVQMAALDPTTVPLYSIYVVNNDPSWGYAIYMALGSPQTWVMIGAVPISAHEIMETEITGTFTATTAIPSVLVGAGLSFSAPSFPFRIECQIPAIAVSVANARGTCLLYDEANTFIDAATTPYPGSTSLTNGVNARILTEPISVAAGTAKTYQLISAKSAENTGNNSVFSPTVLGKVIPIKMRAIPT